MMIVECPCCHGNGFLLVYDMVMGEVQKFQCVHCKDGCGMVEAEHDDSNGTACPGRGAHCGSGGQ
jgi:hypothetical protein